jgi:hypothetical protein
MPDGERALGQRQRGICDEFEPPSDRNGSTPRSHGLERGIMQHNGEQQVGAAVFGGLSKHPSRRQDGRFVLSHFA